MTLQQGLSTRAVTTTQPKRQSLWPELRRRRKIVRKRVAKTPIRGKHPENKVERKKGWRWKFISKAKGRRQGRQPLKKKEGQYTERQTEVRKPGCSTKIKASWKLGFSLPLPALPTRHPKESNKNAAREYLLWEMVKFPSLFPSRSCCLACFHVSTYSLNFQTEA